MQHNNYLTTDTNAHGRYKTQSYTIISGKNKNGIKEEQPLH